MKPGQTVGENISYGTTKPREILIALAVDDGVPNRGHRTNIFAPDWNEMGSCYGPHRGYRDMAVVIYRGVVGSGSTYKGVEPGQFLKEDDKADDTKTDDSGTKDEDKTEPKEDDKTEPTDDGKTDTPAKSAE